MMRGLEHLPHEKRMSKLELFRNRLKGDLTNAYKYLKGRSQVHRSRLFLVVCSRDRIRGKRQKLKCRDFHLNLRKKNLYFVGDRALEQGARSGCGIIFSGNAENPPGCFSVRSAVGNLL